MDKHIEELKQYIKMASMPGSYSPLLEDWKDVYDERCHHFKAMPDRLETWEANMMQLIINEVNPKINRGRVIICFVFVIYAKYRAEVGAIQNAGVAKPLPTIDFEKKWLPKLKVGEIK